MSTVPNQLGKGIINCSGVDVGESRTVSTPPDLLNSLLTASSPNLSRYSECCRCAITWRRSSADLMAEFFPGSEFRSPVEGTQLPSPRRKHNGSSAGSRHTPGVTLGPIPERNIQRRNPPGELPSEEGKRMSDIGYVSPSTGRQIKQCCSTRLAPSSTGVPGSSQKSGNSR